MFTIDRDKYPIPIQDTHFVIDNTKLETYLECPRKFFYTYILGWRVDRMDRNDLAFGKALHEAMEHLRAGPYDAQRVDEAYCKFLESYREEFPESTDAQYVPKTPANAFKALVNYAKTYKHEKYEVHFLETAGTVLVREDRAMHFKMDIIFEDEDGVKFDDYKTTKRLSNAWQNKWALSSQMHIYQHVLNCMFPEERVYGGRVQGFVFRKDDVELIRVPVRKPLDMMEDWIRTTNWYLDNLEKDMHLLGESSPDDLVMEPFHKNVQSCDKYYGCPFMSFCAAWPNPLRKADNPPPGFKVDHWDPRKHEEEASTVIRGIGSDTLEIVKGDKQ